MNRPNLTQSQACEIWEYQPLTGVLTNKDHRSRNAKKGKEAGTLCAYKNGAVYRRVRIGDKKYMTHQIIWLMLYGEWPTSEIDHINGNTLDNRSVNLRVVSLAENRRNNALYKNNSTGITGVRFCIASGRYHSYVCNTYLGSFSTKEEAAKKRYEAEPLFGIHPNSGKRTTTLATLKNEGLR